MNNPPSNDLLPCPTTIKEALDEWYVSCLRRTYVELSDRNRLLDLMTKWNTRSTSLPTPDLSEKVKEAAEEILSKDHDGFINQHSLEQILLKHFTDKTTWDMKNKMPWAPLKPKTAKKCNACNGTGWIEGGRFGLYSGLVETCPCSHCGGKGFK